MEWRKHCNRCPHNENDGDSVTGCNAPDDYLCPAHNRIVGEVRAQDELKAAWREKLRSIAVQYHPTKGERGLS